MKCFSNACKERIGIKPLEDNKLILKSYSDFAAYIKTFKRLDNSIAWHRTFIDSVVKTKIDMLSKKILKRYGSYKSYADKTKIN